MESHSSHNASNQQPGRLLVAGDCANWTTLVAPLVEYGFQVEVVSNVERAGIRCVEQVVDAVVLDLAQELEEISKTIRLLRSVSSYTKIVVVCESMQDVPAVLMEYDNLQSVVSDVSPDDFVRIMRTAVRVARLSRERTERIQSLKSMATRVDHAIQPTADLEKLLRILQAHNPRTPLARVKLPELNTLTQELARSLDPLTASRATVDFIERCLPGSLVVSWLVGPHSQTGLAATAGNGGCEATMAARLIGELESRQLPSMISEKNTLCVDDVRNMVRSIEFDSFAGRWAMLAPCCSHGECHACILIVGPVGSRPSQAEQGLGDVCGVLGAQLAFDARIHRRISPAWPHDSSEDESDLFG